MSNVPVIRPRAENANLVEALQALAKGDWSQRLSVDGGETDAAAAQAYNTVADLLQTLLDELSRVRQQVGREGLHGERVRMAPARGAWRQSVNAVNGVLDDLLGALSQRMDLDLRIDRLVSQSQTLVIEMRNQQETLIRMSQHLTAYEPSQPPLPAAVMPKAPVAVHSRKALIVADDESMRFRIATALAQRGFKTLVADMGKDGLEILLANTDMALVLMDVDAPLVDGADTIHIIRGLKEFASLPIIAIGQARGGASDHLPKPVNPEQLAALIQAWA